jgi:hypothetical protein
LILWWCFCASPFALRKPACDSARFEHKCSSLPPGDVAVMLSSACPVLDPSLASVCFAVPRSFVLVASSQSVS